MALRPGELLADGLCQRLKCFERIPVARYQPAGAALDISESSKTIQLWLKDAVRMLERRIAPAASE
jgi:hypothetical protein